MKKKGWELLPKGVCSQVWQPLSSQSLPKAAMWKQMLTNSRFYTWPKQDRNNFADDILKNIFKIDNLYQNFSFF